MIDETDWGAVCAKEHERALTMLKDAEIAEQVASKLRDKFDADVKLTMIIGVEKESRASLYLEMQDSDAVLKHVNALDSILQPLAVLRFYNATKIGELEKLRKEFYELNDRMVPEGKLNIDDCLTPCSRKVYFQFDGRNNGVWIGKVQLDHITVTLNMRSAKPIDVAMDCDYYHYRQTGRRAYSNTAAARYNEPIKLSKRLIYAGGLSYPDTVYCYE